MDNSKAHRGMSRDDVMTNGGLLSPVNEGSSPAHCKFRLPGGSGGMVSGGSTPRSRSMGEFSTVSSSSSQSSVHVEQRSHRKKKGAAEVYLCVSGGIDKDDYKDAPYQRSSKSSSSSHMKPNSPRASTSSQEQDTSAAAAAGAAGGAQEQHGRPNGLLTGHGELLGNTPFHKKRFTEYHRTRNVKTAPTTPTLDSRDPQQASPSSPVSPHSSSSSSSGSASGGAAPHGAAPSSSTISSTTYTPQTGASPGGTASNAAGSDSAGLGGASSAPASARGGAAEGGTQHTGAPAPSGQDHGDQGATLGPMTAGDMPANCQRTTRLPHKGSESDLYEKVNGVVPMGRLPSNKLVNNLTPRHKNSKVNEKFHRIFRRIPEEELVINAYSCAYFGDILLQGYLYISPNYFCFYSKILSHEKMIEIDVAKVLNITRERTAFIIPNAIGVKTRDSKYVFGSLMSRDNTYKLMWTAWKKVRPDDDGVCEPPVESSDSDAETCSRCGEVLEDRTTHTCNRHLTRTARSPPPGGDEVNGGAGRSGGDGGSSDLDQSPDSGEGGASSSSASRATPSLRRRHHSRTSNSGGAAGGDDGRPLGGATSNSSSATGQPHPQAAHNFNLPYLLQCANFQKLFESIKQLVGKIQSLPRTCVLLAVCTILVIFLLGSAVIMTSKIMLLQSRLDDSHAAIEMSEEAKLNGPSLLYKDTYYLNNQYHIATVEKLHTVLQANIQLLAQVHKRLQSLNAASEGTTDPEACATPDT